MNYAKKVRVFLEKDPGEHMDFWISQGKNIRASADKYLDTSKPIKVLDVGCGMPHWATITFSSWGWNVIGIDVEDVRMKCSYLGLARAWGAKYALKRSLKDKLSYHKATGELISKLPTKVDPYKLDVRIGDITKLDFADNTFDMTFSHVVLEHVPNIPAAVSEMHRVLKPGGIAYHTIHLFPSLTGGHTDEWKSVENPPMNVQPWDHLRGGYYHPSLNKLKEEDYRKVFSEKFDILEWIPTQSGKNFLTPEIEKELSDYSRSDLLTGTVLIIARKSQE